MDHENFPLPDNNNSCTVVVNFWRVSSIIMFQALELILIYVPKLQIFLKSFNQTHFFFIFEFGQYLKTPILRSTIWNRIKFADLTNTKDSKGDEPTF